WAEPIQLQNPKVKGDPHPAGMAWHDGRLFVCCTRDNAVQVVNPETQKVEQRIEVGVAPFTIVFASKDKAYVSNWGGDPPKKGEPQADSSGTKVRTDPKTGVANHGTVSVLQPMDGNWKQTKTIEVGLHPSGIVANSSGKFLYVANANSDSFSVID